MMAMATIIEVMNVAAAQETSFQPNWAIHPGEMLEECLETLGVSQAEFARRADLTPKLVNTILKGHNPVESDAALAKPRKGGESRPMKATLAGPARPPERWAAYRDIFRESGQSPTSNIVAILSPAN